MSKLKLQVKIFNKDDEPFLARCRRASELNKTINNETTEATESRMTVAGFRRASLMATSILYITLFHHIGSIQKTKSTKVQHKQIQEITQCSRDLVHDDTECISSIIGS